MAELQPIIGFHGCHLSAILEFVIIFTSNFYNWCALSLRTTPWKTKSLLINGWVTVNNSVSQPPFCRPSLNLLFDLFGTLTGYVRCHSEQFRKKTTSLSQAVVLRSTNAAYTHTHTHTHTYTHTHTHTHTYTHTYTNTHTHMMIA